MELLHTPPPPFSCPAGEHNDAISFNLYKRLQTHNVTIVCVL